ncbi:hypothetical protein E1263_35890 [Kribbella antibiotica]|uniref:Uncharacterized protein n=1 Tax=Kribbella antibiotica TaxID=190195 RepID=A0A4V2YLI2_9ACTN|nr:hypothetical protein [Kribbella antibiotica]TDD46747.1 hypothetical protein E1263_35890 [Kribbella antibiotica]
MSFLSGLRREWVTIQVPGTLPEIPFRTYVSYSGDELPDVPADAAELSWLEQAARHQQDYLASDFEYATRDISRGAVADLLGDGAALPADFERFLAGDGLRDRLRSATDCYFDLGDAVVPVDGGRLLHLISDSQVVYHWLLYLGDDGGSAVVSTGYPAGFELDAEDVAYWQQEGWEFILVADSFAEFIWRWWMDNEIFFRAAVDKVALLADQQTYVEQYGGPFTSIAVEAPPEKALSVGRRSALPRWGRWLWSRRRRA